MTKTNNLQINVIRQVTGCDREDAEEIRQYMKDHSEIDLGKLKLSHFIKATVLAHLIVMLFRYHKN